MINFVARSGKTSYGVKNYLADTETDISLLPTTCAPGSTCLVAESGNTYILNNSKQWILLPTNSGGSQGTATATTTWKEI